MLDEFIEKFGDLSCAVTGGKNCVLGRGPLYRLLLEMSQHPASIGSDHKDNRVKHLYQNYLDKFDDDQKARAKEMLELARSSYQLRDDDNIHLGRIEAQLLAAVQFAKSRIDDEQDEEARKILLQAVEELDFSSESRQSVPDTQGTGYYQIQARQLIGQPAGPGIAKGKARVIHKHTDLAHFKHGEVLVCDAVDPNITFVVPLAAAVVERRGGMLIHGAIIAREYGLPCITGIPDATTLIETGDEITVDGYLGIVTLGGSGL
jgi:pyruvate,water dikinase